MLNKTRAIMLLSIFLLIGCSENNLNKENEKNGVGKIEDNMSINEMDFQLKEIKSYILDLNDSTTNESYKGVRFEIFLFTDKKIPFESYQDFKLEVKDISDSKILLGPVGKLNVSNTNEGYIYSFFVETAYGKYKDNELENIMKNRDFQMFLVYKGEKISLD
ncbi:hypothetical protein EYB33_12750 [Lysinibacillus sphaericus]|uniref:hypothetical protein n=1 Tax=Lysinibacillus TaxID=400634 RepID=UPI001E63E30B|nr:hypothetical protein [Lysinibacillus sphaericus]UDK97113.1 hypothetical protein EYB33_12750 [Lysinibacillus sphaericus]